MKNPPHPGGFVLRQCVEPLGLSITNAFTNGMPPVSRAEEKIPLMVLADLQIGFHEQIRLQPDIKAAMDGALLEPGDIADFLAEKPTGHEGRIGRAMERLWGVVDSPMQRFSKMVADRIHEEVRTLITENLMSLWPPDQELRLGRDLGKPFPESLHTLSDPTLLKMFEEFRPAANSETGSGVKDWANFNDRMGFIADLFRAYIDDRNLYVSRRRRNFDWVRKRLPELRWISHSSGESAVHR